MNTRKYRWIRLPLNSAMCANLSEGLRKRPFKNEASIYRGFLLDEVRPRSIRGRFVDKYVHTRHMLDPFGKALLIDEPRYDIVDFFLDASGPGIEVSLPVRRMRPFLSAISAILEHSVQITSATIDIPAAFQFLKRDLGSFAVLGIRCKNIALSVDATASVSILGATDVRRNVNALLDGRMHTITEAELHGRSSFGRIILNQSGIVEIESKDVDRVLPVFRAHLVNNNEP